MDRRVGYVIKKIGIKLKGDIIMNNKLKLKKRDMQSRREV
jgi:hypothetical protein